MSERANHKLKPSRLTCQENRWKVHGQDRFFEVSADGVSSPSECCHDVTTRLGKQIIPEASQHTVVQTVHNNDFSHNML